MAKCKNCTRLFKEHDEESEMFGEVWCDKIFDSPDVEAERDCIHYKCMTNADRIRSMTDEELANILLHFEFCDICNPDDAFDCACTNQEVKDKVIEWLRKEIE